MSQTLGRLLNRNARKLPSLPWKDNCRWYIMFKYLKASFSIFGSRWPVNRRYNNVYILVAKLNMFCSPQPNGFRRSDEAFTGSDGNAGPTTSPTTEILALFDPNMYRRSSRKGMMGVSVMFVSRYFIKYAPCDKSMTTDEWTCCGIPSG